MTTALLRVDDLCWTPPEADEPLFAGVAFEVAPGERVVLAGPSGSGKSTLLRCIIGLEPRRSGKIWWHGEEVGAQTIREFRNRVTYVHQRPSQVGETVEENLAFARQMADDFEVADALDEDAQRQMCQRLGLEKIDWSRRFDDLSVGEQQRVCMVRALTAQPDILLLDEPTSALDPERVEQLEDLLVSYVADADQRRALVWVSHQPDQVERVGSRVVDITEWTGEAT